MHLVEMKSVAAVLFAAMLVAAPGCERKEKLLDVETPGGGVEVEQDKDSGAVEVDVDSE